jgi:hypothetical protein
LWQILSENLGEDVNKKKFRAAMERLQVSICSNVAQEESVQINSVNICGEARYPPNIPNSSSYNQGISNTKISYQDLGEMPELGYFYDRASELETLSTLAKENVPVNLAKLLESSGMPTSNLLNALQSLFRRCFLEQQESFYTLPPILREYALRLKATLSNS